MVLRNRVYKFGESFAGYTPRNLVNGGGKTYHWGGGMAALLYGEEGLRWIRGRECRGKFGEGRQWAKRRPACLVLARRHSPGCT